MKRVFLVLLILFIAISVSFVHTRIVVQKTFGPSSMLATAMLACLILIVFVSYRLIDSSYREKVVSFWMVSVSTAITYFAVDMLAGLFLITPLSPELVPDDIRHHKLLPSAYAKFEQKDFSYVQRNNSLGLRGKEVVLAKDDTTFRILMLGDSFTMGKGVEDDETFTYLLEGILNRGRELKECDFRYQRIELLNGGVDSYAPILSWLYLSEELEALEPDMVILSLDNSDLVQEAAYRQIAVRDDLGNVVAVPGTQSASSLSGKFRDWIESNLYITRLILFYTNKWMGHADLTVRDVVTTANAEILAHTLKSDRVDRERQWADIFDSLALIRDFTEERSASFLLALYPWAHQVDDKQWIPGRYMFLSQDDVAIEHYDEKILSLAEQAGIQSISLYETFQNYDGSEKLYFDNDMHFTVRGHQLMAEGIAPMLDEIGLAQRLCR